MNIFNIAGEDDEENEKENENKRGDKKEYESPIRELSKNSNSRSNIQEVSIENVDESQFNSRPQPHNNSRVTKSNNNLININNSHEDLFNTRKSGISPISKGENNNATKAGDKVKSQFGSNNQGSGSKGHNRSNSNNMHIEKRVSLNKTLNDINFHIDKMENEPNECFFKNKNVFNMDVSRNYDMGNNGLLRAPTNVNYPNLSALNESVAVDNSFNIISLICILN